eukprot:m.60096 g.60096  ORF g.60096 m.60096 type:complete len:84 (-) comp7257_c0_seq2:1427-1678(-)
MIICVTWSAISCKVIRQAKSATSPVCTHLINQASSVRPGPYALFLKTRKPSALRWLLVQALPWTQWQLLHRECSCPIDQCYRA